MLQKISRGILNRRFDDGLQKSEHWRQFQYLYNIDSHSRRETKSSTTRFRLLSRLFYVLPVSWNQISDVRVLWERFLQIRKEVWSVPWSHTGRNARSSQSSFSFLNLISVSRRSSKLFNFCLMPRKSVEQMSSVFLVTCVSHRIDWRIDSQTNRPKPAKTRNRAFSGYLVRKSRFWHWNTLPNETSYLDFSIVINK